MTRSNRLTVTIRPVPDSEAYLAIYSSPVLSSSFSVVFPDSVVGAVALHDFAEMLRLRYGKPVELRVETELFAPQSKAVTDLLTAMTVNQMLAIAQAGR